jgi:hypothetical protein
LTDRPDIKLKRGFHNNQNVVCIEFAYNLQVMEVLRPNNPGNMEPDNRVLKKLKALENSYENSGQSAEV